FLADGCDREAMALRSQQALFCMAGITFSSPIRAVLSTPQTTFFMWHPQDGVYPILPAGRGRGKCSPGPLRVLLGACADGAVVEHRVQPVELHRLDQMRGWGPRRARGCGDVHGCCVQFWSDHDNED